MSSRHNSRRKKGNTWALVITGSACLGIAGLLLASFLMRVERDPVTGCNQDEEKIENTYSILIDSTDSLKPVQAQKISNFVSALLETTTTEDRFQVFILQESNTATIEPIFEGCNFVASISEAPALAKFRQSNFVQRLMHSVQSGDEATISPIIHGVNAVSARMPRDHSNKSLILVSDMYENSDIFSMYKSDVRSLLSTQDAGLSSKTPNLAGISVHLLVIDRPELSQDLEFVETWLMYFKDRAKARVETKEVGVGSKRFQLLPAEKITG
jgi:hypothetical protein